MKLTHNDTCLIQTVSHGVFFPTSYMTVILSLKAIILGTSEKEEKKKSVKDPYTGSLQMNMMYSRNNMHSHRHSIRKGLFTQFIA